MLFQQKNITLHSGVKSDFKIECDILTDSDIETLAYLISQKFEFSYVYGIPNGGIRLKEALSKYCDPKHTNKRLLVDDVLTTGGSMEDWKRSFDGVPVQGVVIFARGKCPDWVTPIFQMW